VARMLASGPPQLQRQAADEDMDEAAAAPEAEREADEDEDEAAGPEDSAEETLDPGPELDVAASEEPEGGVLARQPTKTPRRGGVRSVRGLSDRQVREVHRLVGDFLARLGEFERDRLITSEEAERYREAGEAMRRKADDFGTPRRLGAAEAAAFKKRGLKLRSNALRYWDLPKFLRRRAAAGRSTEGLKLISGFAITPPVLRVGHDEAARISFTLGKDARSVSAYILSDPESESTSYRFFNISPTPGYHHAIWDGTFQGSANRPPATGTYRVMISAQDATGRQEQVFDQIRVENPDEETVLPRNASGLDVTSLTFDGSALTLVDAGGNTIRAAAVSGLRPNNPRNTEKKDYTLPEHQWVKNRGPIPAGAYEVHPNDVQQPQTARGGALRFPTGGTASAWGPIRVPIHPGKVGNRSEFFIHLDVTDDGTAGCVGIHSAEQGRFNQIMSLIARSKNNIPLTVTYP
jgi:hypothetical protein